MSVEEKLKECRERKGMTQQEVAEKSGYSRSSIINWEKGLRTPDANVLKTLAQVFGTTVAYLMGETDGSTPLDITSNVRKESAQYFDKWIEVPVLDPTVIACAGAGNGGMTGIYASAEKTILLPAEMVGTISIDADKHPFAVFVEGDSMEGAGIPDRSTVVVNPAEEVYDGDTVLVCFGLQNEWAIKWIYFNKKDGSIEIRSAAPQYKPMLFTKEEIDLGLFRIVGKITAYTGTPRKGI